MTITNSTPEDIIEIFRLYKTASEYQKAKKSVVVWPDFELGLVEKEIFEHRQFKLVLDNEIACVWAVTFSDAEIWEESNLDEAVYLHRIATNPNYRGKNFVGVIMDWAKSFAKTNHKRYIRLDTVGNNTKLIEHYTKAGFDFLGLFHLKNTEKLPHHYKKGPVSLFQIDLEKYKIQPRILQLEEKKLVGQKVKMNLLNDLTSNLWSGFMSRTREIRNRVGEDFISLQVYPEDYFGTFKPEREFQKWALVPVLDLNNIPKDMEGFVLPSGVFAVFHYKGVSADPSIFQYIYADWLPKSGYILDNRPHFEVLGAPYSKNDSNSEEEIWIPIKQP